MAIVPYDGWPWEGRRTLDIGDPPPVGFDESLHLLGVYFKRHGVVGVHVYFGERRAELTSFLWDHENEVIPNADEIENSLRLKGLLATDLDTGLDHPTPVGMDVLRTVEEVMKLSTHDYNNFHFLVYANSKRVWDYAKAMGRQLSHEDFNDWPYMVPMDEYFSHYQERRDLVGPIADNLYMTHIDGWHSQYSSHGIIRVGNFGTRLFKAWADKRSNIIKIKSRQIILDVVGEHIGTEAAVKFAARPASQATAMALAWRDELGLGERTCEVSTDYGSFGVMEEEVVRCYIGGRHVSTFQFYHSEVRQSFESLEGLPVTGFSIVKAHRVLNGQEDFFKNVTGKELEELSRLDLTAESMQSIEWMRGGEDVDAEWEMGEAYIGTWQAGREAGVIYGREYRAPHHTVSYGALMNKGTGEIARVRGMENGTLVLQDPSNWYESLLTAIGREFRRGGFSLYINVHRGSDVDAVSDMLTHLGLEVPEDRTYLTGEVLRVRVA